MQTMPPKLKPATRLDYGRRVARAMALIAADLRRTPSLDELASAAAFSPFHFHRIYRELTGETPAETLSRARLSRAAAMLTGGTAPVARVARDCGYGSAPALTRAFRAAYGLPPAAYRASGGIGTMKPPSPASLEENVMFKVQIRAEPAMRLATLPHRGPYVGIGQVYDRLTAWGTARNLVDEATRFIALYHDDPQSVPDADLRAEAGMTVPADVTGSEGVTIRDLPASRVAVLLFKGPYAELEGAYTWLYRDWLPASGEEPDDQPAREDYLNDPKALPPSEWLTEVMIPLRAKPAA